MTAVLRLVPDEQHVQQLERDDDAVLADLFRPVGDLVAFAAPFDGLEDLAHPGTDRMDDLPDRGVFALSARSLVAHAHREKEKARHLPSVPDRLQMDAGGRTDGHDKKPPHGIMA